MRAWRRCCRTYTDAATESRWSAKMSETAPVPAQPAPERPGVLEPGGVFGPPAGSETAVLEYGRPGDPLFAPKRLVGLDARNVSAWFGTHKVLERVSLTMEPGTVTALIGPSGCGKSTFLRILNRMHEMVAGASLAGQIILDVQDYYYTRLINTDVRRRYSMI